jgi:hypothetical protein
MQLDDWLKNRDPEMTEAEFGDRIGKSQAAVNRYRKLLRYPEPDALDAIMRETDGAVTPNDFLQAWRQKTAAVA